MSCSVTVNVQCQHESSPAPSGRLMFRFRIEDSDAEPYWPTVPHVCIAHKGGADVAHELKPGERLFMEVTPLDKEDNPAPYQVGSAQWSSTNEAAVTVAVNPENELQAYAERVDLGHAFVDCVVDGDPGSAVVPLPARAEITVVSGAATSLGMNAQVQSVPESP